ncbi:MAG TPA: tetratricopeptide repeat protein [Thermoanaerobaculia bacterium]|nr:tetratricopeptide repeat protein [Thermoanaerobaculia bacterium]
MKTLKKSFLAGLVTFSLAFAAVAQEFPTEPHEFLLAKLAAEEGRFEEALERLDRIIQKTPGDPILHYERAMVLIDTGRIDKAEVELRTVVQKSPEFYDANRVLGRILLDRAGADRTKIGEALTYLQAAFKANPDDLSTGVAVSQILRSLDRTAEAERVLAAMVERAPDQRSLNFNYAQVLTSLNRTADARTYLERTVAIDPTFAPAVMQLLDVYTTANEWLKAAEVMAPLISENPMNLELQRQQAYFYLRAGDARSARDRFKVLVGADPKDARSLFYLAESLNDLEEYTESEKLFRQLLAADPNDHDLMASFGLSLAGQKKWDEAAQTFTRLVGMKDVADNVAALARTQLAYIDIQRGNHAAAVETAKQIFVFREKLNPQAINIAIEGLKKQNKHAESVTLLEPLVQQFASDPFINARYVEALVRAGNVAKAREVAVVQSRLSTRHAVAMSEAYMSAGEQPAAISILKGVIEGRPEELDLQFQLGSVYERTNDRKAAEAVFLEVLAKNPQHAPSLNYLGYMWAESGVNLDRAQDMLTRAVGQEPNNGAYVDSLGWVYFRLGKLDLAEKYLTDATRLLPRDATVHEHLGDVLAKRGDMQRALQLYRTAIDLDPESKDIEKIRSKIAEIERGAQTTQR